MINEVKFDGALPEILQVNGEIYYRSPGCDLSDECKRLLSDLYERIWCDAFYDCFNESTRKFARELNPMIARLNEILKFKS